MGQKLKSNLAIVEDLIKNYKNELVKLKCRKIDLNYLTKSESEKVEIIETLKKDIDLLEKHTSNIDYCLKQLDENEYKFISELYFNHKSYKDITLLIKSILNSKANETSLKKYCAKYKKAILNKLLNFNLLGGTKE